MKPKKLKKVIRPQTRKRRKNFDIEEDEDDELAIIGPGDQEKVPTKARGEERRASK